MEDPRLYKDLFPSFIPSYHILGYSYHLMMQMKEQNLKGKFNMRSLAVKTEDGMKLLKGRTVHWELQRRCNTLWFLKQIFNF